MLTRDSHASEGTESSLLRRYTHNCVIYRTIYSQKIRSSSLRKHPFLLALRHRGARRNGCSRRLSFFQTIIFSYTTNLGTEKTFLVKRSSGDNYKREVYSKANAKNINR